MRIYLEAGSGFRDGTDVYGNEIVGSAASDATIRACAEDLNQSAEITQRGIQCVQTADLSTLIDKIQEDDLVVSVHVNFYAEAAGSGLRGYYRSTKWSNSERCKALAITVTKAVHDHVDMYYHGVYNELHDHHAQLEPIVKSKATSCLVEVGFKDDYRDRMNDPTHRNLGRGLAKGILRHLSSRH